MSFFLCGCKVSVVYLIVNCVQDPSVQCQNYGKCVEGGGNSSCECPENYYGDRCQCIYKIIFIPIPAMNASINDN